MCNLLSIIFVKHGNKLNQLISLFIQPISLFTFDFRIQTFLSTLYIIAYFEIKNFSVMLSFVQILLSEPEFETEKDKFLDSTDANILLHAITETDNGNKIIVVTEESAAKYINETYNKIPAICNIFEMGCIFLSELIKQLK